MMDIAEISAAPHFPRALQMIASGPGPNALSALLSALSGSHELSLCELNGELHLASAADPGE